jgi:hypothetical protein
MVQVKQPSGEQLGILAAIQRGMPVYDSEEIKLGTAMHIYWGADTDHPDGDEFQVTFLGAKTLPPEAATLIRHEGCIRVDSGLISGNYYVLPSQVSHITEEGMFLFVRGEQIMMF